MRFGPPLRSNPLGELAHLRRTGTVLEYQQQFLALLCRTEHLSSKQQVQLFTAGLRNPLKTDVELQNPSNLQTAMSLARAYEHHGEDDPANTLPPVRAALSSRFSAPSPHQPTKPPPGATSMTAQPFGSTAPVVSGSAGLSFPAAPRRP